MIPVFLLALVSVVSPGAASPLLGGSSHHHHHAAPSESDDDRLAAALKIGQGLYRRSPPGLSLLDQAALNGTVLAVSCNFAVLDILLNWACHADRLGLNFVLLAMDAELAVCPPCSSPALALTHALTQHLTPPNPTGPVGDFVGVVIQL